MPTVTEKSQFLYGCRLGPTAIRQLVRIASEGIDNAHVSLSHTCDNTKFTADTLDDLLEAINDSSVVTDMADCSNLTIVASARDVYNTFAMRPDNIYALFRGPDREAVLGKFETAIGYLKGHGATTDEVGAVLRSFWYVVATGLMLQLVITAVGKMQTGYVVAGIIVNFISYLIAMQVKRESIRRRMNLINAVEESLPSQRGWADFSLANKIATIVAALTAIGVGAAVASAIADWVK